MCMNGVDGQCIIINNKLIMGLCALEGIVLLYVSRLFCLLIRILFLRFYGFNHNRVFKNRALRGLGDSPVSKDDKKCPEFDSQDLCQE